ncbi:hypothetical protein, partial [Deinococcus pimensis]|uniref:hypothetical protein n=1 Tax=Deinococcus pimensis TaxID=309888 RepID=UPI0005EAFC53
MTLRLRLVALCAGLTLVTVLTLTAVVGVQLWRAEVRAVNDEVVSRVDALASLDRRSPNALSGAVDDLLTDEEGVFRVVVLRAGRVVYASDDLDAPLDPAFVPEDALRGARRVGDAFV